MTRDPSIVLNYELHSFSAILFSRFWNCIRYSGIEFCHLFRNHISCWCWLHNCILRRARAILLLSLDSIASESRFAETKAQHADNQSRNKKCPCNFKKVDRRDGANNGMHFWERYVSVLWKFPGAPKLNRDAVFPGRRERLLYEWLNKNDRAKKETREKRIMKSTP